jgi:DUF438 domain-containing protein
MPEVGAIDGHGIGGTLDIVQESKIVEVTLMQTRDAKKVGRRTGCCSGPFSMSDKGRNIVAQALSGALTAVHFWHRRLDRR